MAERVLQVDDFNTFSKPVGVAEDALGTTPYARARARIEARRRLGPRPGQGEDMPVRWTDAEVVTLRTFAHQGAAKIAERLGRKVSQVQQKASALGISLRAAAPRTRPALAVPAPPDRGWSLHDLVAAPARRDPPSPETRNAAVAKLPAPTKPEVSTGTAADSSPTVEAEPQVSAPKYQRPPGGRSLFVPVERDRLIELLELELDYCVQELADASRTSGGVELADVRELIAKAASLERIRIAS